jgi:hypothetical protein
MAQLTAQSFRIIKWGILAIFFIAFLSCEDMLKTDTDHFLNTDGHELNSPNDTLYSMTGIFRKMQTIADRYVLVGELRGDLMDITQNADLDLQAIARFDFGMTDKNPYLDTKAWYDVINNCNFFIQRADTSVKMAGGRGVMDKELAMVKTIRAWVYMQLILDYGQAWYYKEPILTVEDVNKIKNDPSRRIFDLNTLFDREYESLLEAMAIQKVQGTGFSYETHLLLPATLVLADLCLHTDRPALAAELYHDFLYTGRLTTDRRSIRWADAGFSNSIAYAYGYNDLIATILTTTENETGSYLMGWCYPSEWSSNTGANCTYQVKPSNEAMNIWDRQDYAFLPSNATALDEPSYTAGDMRGGVKPSDPTSALGTYTEATTPPYKAGVLLESYGRFITSESDTLPFILKYGARDGTDLENLSYIYRVGPVYLRYAEALWRLGKPTLAFAILKYGAANTVFNDPTKVNPEEVTPLPAYCNFPDLIFPNIKGIHSRGSGVSDRNMYYVIPAGVDTIRFVGEKIFDEMAMESAFEGNRFHDLMRFAGYYGNDFLATRVAKRRGVEDPALKAKLLDERNWYLPHN